MRLVNQMGASWAGTKCPRHLWLRWRNAYDVIDTPPLKTKTGKTIFEVGKEAEATIVQKLRDAGYTIITSPREAAEGQLDVSRFHIEVDGSMDDQLHILHPDYPYLTGYLDGILKQPSGRIHVLEMKTMAVDKFMRCRDLGICSVYPIYADQIQIYMYLTGISKGVFAYSARSLDGVVDPTNPMFFNIEYVELEKEHIRDVLRRIETALKMPIMPAKPRECVPFCRYELVCKERDLLIDRTWPVPTCRTCRNWAKCGDAYDSVCREYDPIHDLLPTRTRKRQFGSLEEYLAVSGQTLLTPVGERRKK